MKKHIAIFMIIIMLALTPVKIYAQEELESISEYTVEEVLSQAEGIINGLESILDPDDNSLAEEAENVMDKFSDNPLVKILNAIIDAISSFIEAVFRLASEASKIGVE